jgi:hypothetical protein
LTRFGSRLGLANPSEDGGMDELVEFNPNRRRNSAFSASSHSTRCLSSITIARRSSYDGCGDSSSTAEDHAIPPRPTTRDTPLLMLNTYERAGKQ